jgi:hypothetical protein
VIRTEGWSKAVMDAADRSHFASATSTLFRTVGWTGCAERRGQGAETDETNNTKPNSAILC